MNTRIQKSAEGMDNRKALWVFTPSRTDPEVLEFILVQRQELLQDAVERVKESALTDHKHHLLFVGPRGCGKTHLVTLIVNRLSQDEKLADRLRIAWLNEDETCTTLLEFLLKIHAALEKRYPDEFREEALDAVYEMKPEAASERVSNLLLTALGSRTLMVVAENLDAIFDGLGDVGQKQLRAFIQENPKFSIVATAQRLVENLSSRTSPFFGFFQTEHLKSLDVHEATELLIKIARLQEQTTLVEFLSTSRGRSRVRALHHLSGGDHRIYIVLSQFITRDSIESLLRPFMKMVDELTPYYQERVRWLPPQQRKIVEYLCGCEGTVSVKEIAKKLFATSPTISSQLQDLREKGYVEASQRGRESLYEISEPLMRICVEVKETQRNQPLRLLVDFLRVWYDDQELSRRIGTLGPATESRAYLESAVERNKVEGNLRKRLFLEDLRLALPEKMNSVERERMIQECANLPEAVALALSSLHEGNKIESIRCLDEAIAEESRPTDKADLLFTRAELQTSLADRRKAIKDYTAVIGLPDALVDQVAKALLNRGITYGQTGETQREIEDYTAVIGLPNAPVEQVAKALYCRGITYGQTGETQRAIEDYTAVIGLPDAPVEQIAKALFYRGVTFVRGNQKQEAQKDFETLTQLAKAPANTVVNAYLKLSELHLSEGRWSEGFDVLEKGLACGAKMQPPYFGTASDLIGVLFTAGLNPEARVAKVTEFLAAYERHQTVSVLGEGLVKHVGHVFRSGAPFPSTDNLEQWASAWEQAGATVDEFRLSLRLLRTGINYLKADGKDPGVLLDLTAAEREILKQSLGLADTGNF